MADDFSLFSVFDSQDVHKPLEDLIHEIIVTQHIQVSNCRSDIPGEVDPSTTDIRSSEHPINEEEARVHLSGDQEKCVSGYVMDINLKSNSNVNTITHPDQLIFKGQNHELSLEESDSIQFMPNKICTESFRILGNYGKGKERFREGIIGDQCSKSTVTDNKLTTEEIMRAAAERFIHFSNKKLEGITSFIHPDGSALSSLSPEDTKMVDLAHLLLDSAEKVSSNQFDAADKLLKHFAGKVSESGNRVERIIYHFSKALQEKITTEIRSRVGMIETGQVRDYSGLSSGVDLTCLVLHQAIPFSQVMQFASIQTKLESVSAKRKIHLIDLKLRNGAFM